MAETTEFIPGGFACGPGPHLHNRQQAAVLLCMGDSTLKRLIAARLVPFTRPPGTTLTLLSDDDLRAIIAAGRVATTAETKPRPTSRRRTT